MDLKPASARTARRFVASTLRDWACQDATVETAALLTSELVTNAVLHGRGPIEVVVRAGRGRLRVEVFDGSRALPAPRAHADDATTGRGLTLVEALATRWGADPAGTGKRVWFEVPA